MLCSWPAPYGGGWSEIVALRRSTLCHFTAPSAWSADGAVKGYRRREPRGRIAFSPGSAGAGWDRNPYSSKPPTLGPKPQGKKSRARWACEGSRQRFSRWAPWGLRFPAGPSGLSIAGFWGVFFFWHPYRFAVGPRAQSLASLSAAGRLGFPLCCLALRSSGFLSQQFRPL